MITHFNRPQRMSLALTRLRGIGLFRHFVPIVGLFAAGSFAICAAPAQAQVNIDQGKSAAEMFSGDCATCHKSAKGLANGRNSGALAGFLREHYTSSPQQAASLAAYVLGAGSGPAPSANLKPGTGAAEPKAAEAKPGEVKPGEAKPGERGRPGREPATAKLQQPEQDTKTETEPANEPAAAAAAGRKPTAGGKHEPRSVTASRGPRQEPETPPPPSEAAPAAMPETTPAPVAIVPATPETSSPGEPQAEPAMPVTAAAPGTTPESGAAPTAPATPEASPSSSATAASEAPAGEGAPADSAPVPRDDIPD